MTVQRGGVTAGMCTHRAHEHVPKELAHRILRSLRHPCQCRRAHQDRVIEHNVPPRQARQRVRGVRVGGIIRLLAWVRPLRWLPRAGRARAATRLHGRPGLRRQCVKSLHCRCRAQAAWHTFWVEVSGGPPIGGRCHTRGPSFDWLPAARREAHRQMSMKLHGRRPLGDAAADARRRLHGNVRAGMGRLADANATEAPTRPLARGGPRNGPRRAPVTRATPRLAPTPPLDARRPHPEQGVPDDLLPALGNAPASPRQLPAPPAHGLRLGGSPAFRGRGPCAGLAITLNSPWNTSTELRHVDVRDCNAPDPHEEEHQELHHTPAVTPTARRHRGPAPPCTQECAPTSPAEGWKMGGGWIEVQ